ncbi:MAG TPA: HAMP domain-containing sensor histidine kinase [Planctomycetaceae bacterium]|nr:HAMP domain-containing sensor histidine kinase [Planctomycetaceae bacterium]
MRPRLVWPAFLVCVGIIAAAMGWMTDTMLRLERAEALTVRQSENERLALWRMDSLVMPLVAQESARPPGDYQAFVPAADAYSKSLAPIKPGDVHTPSALLVQDSPHIRIHFELNPIGVFTCPQVPTSNFRDLAEANYTTPERISASSADLEQLKQKVSWGAICDAAALETDLWTPRSDAAVPVSAPAVNVELPADQQVQQEYGNFLEQQLAQGLQAQSRLQSSRSMNELFRRGQTVAANSGAIQQRGPLGRASRADGDGPLDAATGTASPAAESPSPGGAAAVHDLHPMRGVWIADSLLLVRRLRLNGEDVVQGCLLDWPQIQERLLAEVEDLLPDARLVPVTSGSESDEIRPLMLASLPVRLVPGLAVIDVLPGWTPMQISLVTAWIGLVLAAAAVAALLQAAMRLSERRGAFVSAVTHELRTPLTTFQLYTEMLSEGMVPTEEKRQHYLDTLRVEAGRLAHLVENVLSYSRLEGSRSRTVREAVAIDELLARLEQPLRDRAARDGMEIAIDQPSDGSLVASGDPSAVERILFNLVDNACKYAAGASDRRIHIEARFEAGRVMLRVRDHGAGITRRQARRLFRPFSKSATEAAHSAPGVGLGLALCRRLARSMGGDLWIDHGVEHGACLVLSLPFRAR